MEIETKPQSGTVLYSKLVNYPAKHLEENHLQHSRQSHSVLPSLASKRQALELSLH